LTTLSRQAAAVDQAANLIRAAGARKLGMRDAEFNLQLRELLDAGQTLRDMANKEREAKKG